MPVVIEVQAILPEKDFIAKRWDKTEKELKAYLNIKAKNTLVGELNRTTENWKHKPVFKGTVTTPRGQIWLTVLPTGEGKINWIRVSRGTRSRDIVPRRPDGKLRFLREYAPKTTSGGKWGGSGARYGDLVVTKKVPSWPGIEAREFEKKIVEDKKDDIVNDLDRIIKRVWK